MNKVSIIMTCHNGQEYLEKALQSIKNQTYRNWELIFLNNNSKDNSEKILSKYKDKRIFYFKSKKTLNLGRARQLAFNKCRGDFITFLDTDDLWSKNKLKMQINKFKSNNKIDVLYGKYFILKNNISYKRQYKKLIKGKCKEEIILSYIDGKPYTAWLTLMIKKKAINSLKYAFDKNLHIASDFDLILRLSNFCYFDYSNIYFGFYRIHLKNESVRNKYSEIKELVYIFKKIKNDPINKKNLKVIKFVDKLYLKKFLLDKIKNIKSNIKISMIKKNYFKIIYLFINILPSFLLKNLYK